MENGITINFNSYEKQKSHPVNFRTYFRDHYY